MSKQKTVVGWSPAAWLKQVDADPEIQLSALKVAIAFAHRQEEEPIWYETEMCPSGLQSFVPDLLPYSVDVGVIQLILRDHLSVTTRRPPPWFKRRGGKDWFCYRMLRCRA